MNTHTTPLTLREWSILRAKATGAVEQVIAHDLGISPQTVKNHLSFIYRKLDVTNAIEALAAVGWLYVPAAERLRLYVASDDLGAIEAEARMLVARARAVADETEAFADGLARAAS